MYLVKQCIERKKMKKKYKYSNTVKISNVVVDEMDACQLAGN